MNVVAPVSGPVKNQRASRRPSNLVEHLAPFYFTAGRPHKNVFEDDMLVASRKQSVALQASNLAVVPTTLTIDCDNLVLCPAGRTAEKN
jgi:hypothetical protein